MEGGPRERIVELYVRLGGAIQKAAPSWLEVDLSMGQLKALWALIDGGAQPIGSVARRLGIGLPAASVAVDRLVEQGLAERREDSLDRRRTLASATPAGESLAANLRHGRRELLLGWLNQLSDRDVERLAAGLQALAEVAEAVPAEIGTEASA